MPYVSRSNGKVSGVFANLQMGYGEEYLDADDPEVSAYFGSVNLAPSQDDYTAAIQAHLDATARIRQYDGINSAVTYRGDPNPRYAAEAEALFVWRSNVWTFALTEMKKVIDDDLDAPSIEAIIAQLPTIQWPEI